MAGLTSKAAICNRALKELGQPPLVTDPEGLQEYSHAETVLRAYDDLFDIVLTESKWTFASTRAQLEPDATAPDFGWAYRYALPGDCKKFWGLDEERHGKSPRYDIEGGFILSDEGEGLNVYYLRSVTDPTKFSPDFAFALAVRIAEASALEILGSNDAADWFERRAEAKASKAATKDSQQTPPREIDDGSWTIRRRTG